jgi:excisionase family DNA binding protein
VSIDDPISVREAAEELKVDERAVRLMASAGEIEAVKRGNAWWLDRRSVERRRRQQPGRGRPLSAPMAWSVLLLASGIRGPGEPRGKDHRPARARRWLDSHALDDHAPRLRARARRESLDGHPSELPRLAARPDVMRTGISAANVVGVHGGGGEVELYAPAGRRPDILAQHALEPGDGPVLMRWVPDELWPTVAGDVAPRAAVLVDLLEHDDPRARREADRALRHR